MFAGFLGDPGLSGPLNQKPVVHMGGYCLIGDGEHHTGAATAALIDGSIANKDEIIQRYRFEGVKNTAHLVCLGYETVGRSFFAELAGDFNLALIDSASGTCFLQRSSSELRPLYWQRLDSRRTRPSFVFADSLRTWTLLNRRTWRLDRSGLSAFLHLGFFPSFFTPIEGVDRLLPGYVLEKKNSRFSLAPTPTPLPEAAAATQEKPHPVTKPFTLSDLAEQVWALDMPLAVIFIPALAEHPYRLALSTVPETSAPNIYYNTPIRLEKKLLRRFFSLSLHPILFPFWIARQLKRQKKIFQEHNALFTHEQLRMIAPRIFHRFHFSAFVAKVLCGRRGKAHFFDHEAMHFAHAFDPKAKESLSCHSLICKDAFFEKYISDEAASTIYSFLEEGALCDHDILRKQALQDVSLSKRQLWALAQLEMWMQFFYEGAPTEEHRHAVESKLLVASGAKVLL